MPFPIAAAIMGGSSLLGGLMGSSSARRQARAQAEAAAPKPFDEHLRQSPWEPTQQYLTGFLSDFAFPSFQRQMRQSQLPAFQVPGIRGASQGTRQLFERLMNRDNSAFLGGAQDTAQRYMRGDVPQSPYFDQAFRGAQQFSQGGYAPLNRFIERGMGGGFNPGAPYLQSFVGSLMGDLGFGLPQAHAMPAAAPPRRGITVARR